MDAKQASTEDLEQLFNLALQHQSAGDVEASISAYRQILALSPHNPAALHNLGSLEMQAGNLATAAPLLQQALLLNPDQVEIRDSARLLALRLYHNQFWESAKNWLQRALRYDGNDLEVRHALERVDSRDYLEPEIFCNSREETLRRYAPRESHTYVYAIDIVGTCNLRCPTCPVGNFPEAERSKGFMELELFEKILEKISQECPADVPELFFFNWGEPLLHPQLPAFIRAANAYRFPVTLSSNLNIKTDLEPIIAAGPATLKVSMSGFRQDTYEQTHVRGRVDKVKENLFTLRRLIDKHQSSTQVYIGHHIYTHNAEETAEVRQLCDELGFLHAPITAFFQPLEKLKQVLDGDLRAESLPVIDLLKIHPRERREMLSRVRSQNYDCELRFNQTAINHDGSVALCCSVYDSENMLAESFLDKPHKELEALKYSHSFCKTCKDYEMDYSPVDLHDRVAATD